VEGGGNVAIVCSINKNTIAHIYLTIRPQVSIILEVVPHNIAIFCYAYWKLVVHLIISEESNGHIDRIIPKLRNKLLVHIKFCVVHLIIIDANRNPMIVVDIEEVGVCQADVIALLCILFINYDTIFSWENRVDRLQGERVANSNASHSYSSRSLITFLINLQVGFSRNVHLHGGRNLTNDLIQVVLGVDSISGRGSFVGSLELHLEVCGSFSKSYEPRDHLAVRREPIRLHSDVGLVVDLRTCDTEGMVPCASLIPFNGTIALQGVIGSGRQIRRGLSVIAGVVEERGEGLTVCQGVGVGPAVYQTGC